MGKSDTADSRLTKTDLEVKVGEELGFYGIAVLPLVQSLASLQTRPVVSDSPWMMGTVLLCLQLVCTAYVSTECYRDHLVELECVIKDSQLFGSVVILGDFNANLGGEGNEGEQIL